MKNFVDLLTDGVGIEKFANAEKMSKCKNLRNLIQQETHKHNPVCQ